MLFTEQKYWKKPSLELSRSKSLINYNRTNYSYTIRISTMNWTLRNFKLLNGGYGFLKSKITRRTEQRMWQSRYQLYEPSSDLSHIRVRADKVKPFKYQHFLLITLSNDLVRLQVQQRHTTVLDSFDGADENLELIRGLLEHHDDLSNMFANDQYALVTLKHNEIGTEFTYDFVVNMKDWEEEEQPQFDLAVLTTTRKPSFTFTKELRPFSLQSLRNTATVPFTLPGNKFEYSLNTEICTDKDVKFRNVNHLCEREKTFITRRKTEVFNNMRNKLGLDNCLQKTEDTPNIAIIGSGGGMRAAVGMSGAMTALQDIGIYECSMYTAGLSGSAWYLLLLYGYDKQHCPKAAEEIIIRKVLNFRTLQTWKVSPKWFSITDTFGDIIGELLCGMKQSRHCWSDQTRKLIDGSVPLPLINALRVIDKKTIKDNYEWIEFSPYEVFLPKYGAAIDMKYFGDKFYGGFAVAEHSGRSIRDLKGSEWYLSFRGIQDRIRALFKAVDSTSIGKIPNFLNGIPEYKAILNDTDSETDIIGMNQDDMKLVDAGSVINSPYPTVLHPSRKVDLILSFDFSERDEDNSWPFQELQKAEKWANTRQIPFPKLNPRLKKIKEDWERGNYEEVYVFPGDNAPTIVHFVLINQSSLNAHDQDDAKQNFKIFPVYRTKRYKYCEQEIDQLKLLVQNITLKNKKTITECIKEVIERKQNKSID